MNIKRSLKRQDHKQQDHFLFCRRQQSGELYKEPLLATYRPDQTKIRKTSRKTSKQPNNKEMTILDNFKTTEQHHFLFCRRQQSGEPHKEPLLATYRPDQTKIPRHDVGKEDSLLLLPPPRYHGAGKYGLYESPGHHYVLPY
jgi:hypothetical protein